jgi:hypothetical protein
MCKSPEQKCQVGQRISEERFISVDPVRKVVLVGHTEEGYYAVIYGNNGESYFLDKCGNDNTDTGVWAKELQPKPHDVVVLETTRRAMWQSSLEVEDNSNPPLWRIVENEDE